MVLIIGKTFFKELTNDMLKHPLYASDVIIYRMFHVGGRNRFSAAFEVRDLKRETERMKDSISDSEWSPLFQSNYSSLHGL